MKLLTVYNYIIIRVWLKSPRSSWLSKDDTVHLIRQSETYVATYFSAHEPVLILRHKLSHQLWDRFPTNSIC